MKCVAPWDVMCCAFAAAGLMFASIAQSAVLVPVGLNRIGLRPMMTGEGLLEQQPNPFVTAGPRIGAEYTGWVDIRHPALSGGTSTLLGYDRYDRRFDQATTFLTDVNGITANANVPRDLNHTNRVYATQAGVSVIERQTRGYTSPAAGMPGSFDFALSFAEERDIMMQNVGGNRVNNYYARDLTSGAYGETYNPALIAGGNNEALFIAERVPQGAGFIPITRNTQAHEFTHFVTNGQGLHMPNGSHSNDPRNIIGEPQWDPGQNGTPIGNIPDNDTVAGPAVSTVNGMAGGVPKVGGISQLKRSQLFTPGVIPAPNRGVFGDVDVSPYLSKTHNLTAANRVDWNFAVDDWYTEDLTGADDFPGGRESLYFTSGNATAPADPAPTADNGGKNKNGLGVFNNPGSFAGAFRFVDVFSITARYGDYDVDDAGNESFRADALDYDVTFVLPGNSFVAGIPTDVFIDGWSASASADDYLARWMSPADAIGVLVTAHRYTDLVTGENIGNTQIDAVIAFVPEPVSAACALLVLLAAAKGRSLARRHWADRSSA
ncbi:hypothetical protein BH09PLA1_BH09PLA1_13750 [soil metagenome]